MQNNCGHLSIRSDGIECVECGFISCIRCIEAGNICRKCNIFKDNFSSNSMKLLLDPNCQNCPKCNRLSRCLGSKHKEKETWCSFLSRFLCMSFKCVSGKEDRAVMKSYYITHHYCCHCDLDFVKEVEKLITSYDTIHVKPKH